MVNLAVLLAMAAAIPFGIRAYKPVENNNKAVDALNNRQFDQAIALLSEAVEKHPDNSTFRRNLLAAYNSKAIDVERQGKDAESLEWYEKALALDPQNQTVLRNYIATLNNLAVACSKEKKFPDSQNLFERASKCLALVQEKTVRDDIRHNYSALLTLWGAELMKHNRVEDAIRAFAQSTDLDTSNSVALIYLGDLHYERNQYAEARRYYAAAKPMEKENAEYLAGRLQMINDESKVEGRFKELRDPNDRFVVQYIDYNGGVQVPELLNMLVDARETIGKKLGIHPARTVSVKIYRTEDFHKISRLPEWAIGIFDGKMRLDVQHVQHSPSQVRDLVFHEYTHAVLAMNVRQKVPAWFHEGLAQLMEPQFAENTREQAQMHSALARNKFDFRSIQNSFKDIASKEEAEQAYLVSKYFLASLNRMHGQEKLLSWIAALVAEKEFEQSFATIYGSALDKAQNDWMQKQIRK